MIAGGIIMLIISANYAYLMNVYPDAGGAFTYSSVVLGYDYGFLTAWFLAITYLAMLWANATSIPLFARYFIGNAFRIVRLYSISGYEVYLGEALLSIGALLIVAFFCARYKKAMTAAMILLGVAFSAGITACFIAAALGHPCGIQPGFVPESSALNQIVRIAVISPWAFIGFENISHATEEMRFRSTLLFRVLLISVLSTTALYVLVTILSVTAFPPEYATWLDYIRDCGNLEGVKGLPAFYAAHYYLGDAAYPY